MLDVQAVLRPWSSHAWRVALTSTAVALPLHVLPAGAGAASPGQPLQQPPQAQIASALDLAADNVLPPRYPRLDGVPSVPAVVHVARHISLGSADNAAYVADVTIPDGTILSPGQRFTKTWQIQNTGTSTWDGRYHWQFEAGAPLGTVRVVTAPAVPPGATALFSVEMVAPQQPGSYRGFWQMTDPSGAVFGHQAWVVVHVEAGSSATLTPLPTATG